MTSAIKILTYNTHLFGSSPAGVAGGLATGLLKLVKSNTSLLVYEDDERRDAIQSGLQRLLPDIIGLTEVWDRRHAAAFRRGLEMTHPYAAGDGLSSGQGSGLLLLSRFPLSDIRFVAFRTLSGMDDRATKGFIAATALIGSTVARIVLTHTQADEDADARAARADNFAQIREELERNAGPALLMGDFNVIAENQDGSPTVEYRAVTDSLNGLGMLDLYRAVHGDVGAQPGFTYDATIPNSLIAKFSVDDFRLRRQQRLDFIYGRDCCAVAADVPMGAFLRGTRLGAEPLSDHDPLLVALSVGQG